MSQTVNIAIYAAETLAGETLIRQLEEPLSSGALLPVLNLLPISESPGFTGVVEFHGATLECVTADDADFVSTDFLLMPAGCSRDAQLMTRAIESGCTVIDASKGAAMQGYTMPVLPGLNEHMLAELAENRYLAVPGSAAASLLPVLQRIHQQFSLSRINLVLMQPAAALGKSGVDALRQQTIDLLNGKPAQQGVERLAYNLVPEQPTQEASQEVIIRSEFLLALGEELDIRVTNITAPVFFGDSCVVDLDTVQTVEIHEIRSLLAEFPEVLLAEADELPTIADAAGTDQLHIGNLSHKSDYGTDLSFWLVVDSFKRSAIHSVELLELLIKDLAE